MTSEDMTLLLDRLQRDSSRFRDSLMTAVGRSRFDETRSEDRITELLEDFDRSADQLRDRSRRGTSAPGDVEEIMRRAARIDHFMARNTFDSRTQNDWANVRRDLDDLADGYGIARR
jgi:hypothetical protein